MPEKLEPAWKYRCRACNRTWESFWKLAFCECGSDDIECQKIKSQPAPTEVDELYNEQFSNVLERVMMYAGQEFDSCRYGNPSITKRDTIELANDIKRIIDCYITSDEKMRNLLQNYRWRKGYESRRLQKG